jgi:hypothetical protein
MSIVSTSASTTDSDASAESPKVIAAGKMISAIDRLRTAMRALTSTMANVAKNCKGGIDKIAVPNEWTDLLHIVTNNVGALERSWREEVKPSPKDTETYRLVQTIIWDLYQLMNSPKIAEEMAPILTLVADPLLSAWPLEIIWEKMCKDKYATHCAYIDPESKTRKVRASYEKRVVKEGTASFTYPGFGVHIEWKREGSFYHGSLPFAAILNIVRELTKNGSLPPRMGTDYIGTFVFIYYELILATYDYYVNLNSYLASSDAKMIYDEKLKKDVPDSKFTTEDRFGRVLQYVPTVAGDDRKITWLTVFERAHEHAKNVCSNYYGGIDKNGQGSLLGMNAGDLAKDPSKISGMLEQMTGIPGLGIDTLRKLPGFDGILSGLGLGTNAAPAAGASASSSPAVASR